MHIERKVNIAIINNNLKIKHLHTNTSTYKNSDR